MSCSQMLLGCGRSGSWSPTQLTSLAAWYEAGPEYCYTDGAAQFTAASSQYLSCASNSSLQTGDVDFWMAGWVWLDAKDNSRTFLGKYGNPAREYVVWYYKEADRLRFNVVGSNFETGVNSAAIGSPVTGSWYFILCWHDSVNNTINIKVNNGTTDSAAHSDGVNVTSTAFELGRLSTYNQHHDGRLDSVCFGKSPPGGIAGIISTISSRLYNSGDGLAYADLTEQEKTDWGLVSFWNLNEASGTRNDSHGTNHLTDNNSVGLAAGIARGQCGDGDPIAVRLDNSGNSRTLVQTDVLKRPTLRLVNGKWVVRGDGINDWMYYNNTPPISTAWSAAVAAKIDTTGTQYLLDCNTTRRRYLSLESGAFRCHDAASIDSAALTNATWYKLLAVINGASSKNRANGTEVTGTIATSATASTAPLVIGARYDQAAGFFASDMADIVIVDGELSAQEIQQLETYLASKIP